MKSRAAVCTSSGKKREINQDNFFINGIINEQCDNYLVQSFPATDEEQILALCDGMGGENDGEIAARLVVEKLKEYCKKHDNLFENFEEHADSFIRKANRRVCAHIRENDGRQMGTTIALLCVSGLIGEGVAANVGDSKVYLFREGGLKKLSEDHNQAQGMVNMGIIGEAEARTHKSKSKLTQFIGIEADEFIIEPFISDIVILKKKDILLMCSDGLTDMLGLDEIESVLSEKISIKSQCKKLVEKANFNGGNDNITVIICEIL